MEKDFKKIARNVTSSYWKDEREHRAKWIADNSHTYELESLNTRIAKALEIHTEELRKEIIDLKIRALNQLEGKYKSWEEWSCCTQENKQLKALVEEVRNLLGNHSWGHHSVEQAISKIDEFRKDK